MIDSGMVEWLVTHLKWLTGSSGTTGSCSSETGSTTSTYGLEYSTALFMNLCLHKSGKQKCLPIAEEVLTIFADLLSSKDKKQVNCTKTTDLT